MHLELLFSLQAAAAVASASQVSPGVAYSGRAGQLRVGVPRVEAQVAVDGRLDEPVWGQAAVLRDFSQFRPNDGVAAVDSTEVLVWYSPVAIHFGIRARE